MTLAECEVARKMFWHWTWVMHMLVILMASNKICCWNDGRPCYECYSAVLQSIHLSLTSKPVSLTPLLHINMLWLFPKIWKIHFVQDLWMFWSFIHSFTTSLPRAMKSPEDYRRGCFTLSFVASYLFTEKRFNLSLVKFWLGCCSLSCLAYIGQAPEEK